MRFVNMSVPFSAGALYSTVLDLYKWDQAVDAGKLIPNNLMDAMLTGHVVKDGPGSAKYGFGWTISTEFGHKVIWHGGGLEGFTSLNSWFPNNDAYVIVLDNVASPEVLWIGHALAAILFGQKYEVPQEHKEIALGAGTLGKFVGNYQLAPNFVIAITLAGDQLFEQATAQKACPIFPESNTEFFLKAVDAQISFGAGFRGQGDGARLSSRRARCAGEKGVRGPVARRRCAALRGNRRFTHRPARRAPPGAPAGKGGGPALLRNKATADRYDFEFNPTQLIFDQLGSWPSGALRAGLDCPQSYSLRR